MSATAIDLQPYASLIDEDCDKHIICAREALGDRVIILGHHYQRDEIFNIRCSAMRALHCNECSISKTLLPIG